MRAYSEVVGVQGLRAQGGFGAEDWAGLNNKHTASRAYLEGSLVVISGG